MVWAELLHIVGSWAEVATTPAGQFGAQVLSILAIGVGVFALTRVARGDDESSAPFVLIAAVTFMVAAGSATSRHGSGPSCRPRSRRRRCAPSWRSRSGAGPAS